MRVGIVGQHPVAQPGWRAIVSLYAAKWLTAAGDEVDLYLPMPDQPGLAEFLRGNDVARLDDLQKFDVDFRIRPVFLDEPAFDGHYDVLIWQATSDAERATLGPAAQAAADVITANSGKIVPVPTHQHMDLIRQRFALYDLIGCALHEDYDLLHADPLIRSEFAHRYCYAPRGADEELLRPDGKADGPPVIGMDTPAIPYMRAIEHYVPALEMVRQRHPDVVVLTMSRRIPLDWVEVVTMRPYPDIYLDFFDRIWLYLVIDFAKSPSHLGKESRLMPDRWGTRAKYELQNIEAQMAGAAIVGHPSNVIEELVEPGASWLRYDDYDDPEAIAAVLIEGIEHNPTYAQASRAWAMRNHRWQDCIGTWRTGMLELVENGYRRRHVAGDVVLA